MIMSTSGSLITTSSSTRLWSLIQFEHPFAEFIIQASRNLADYKLYFASLVARLLQDDTRNIDQQEIVDMIKNAAIHVDVGDINNMINFTKSIIKTKAKSAGLLKKEVDALSIKVVESWLKSLPEESDELGEVVVNISEGRGSDNAIVTKGLLYRHDPTYEDNINDMHGPIKVNI